MGRRGLDKTINLWYNVIMRKRQEYNHKCGLCGKSMKSDQKPHKDLKVYHVQCAYDSVKDMREKVKKNC